MTVWVVWDGWVDSSMPECQDTEVIVAHDEAEALALWVEEYGDGREPKAGMQEYP